MKKSTLLIASSFLLLASPCLGQQNLIINGSFEALDKCPTGGFDFPATGWRILCGTPDLFASCVRQGEGSAVPNNFEGTRDAFAGRNYAGIFLLIQKATLKTSNYQPTESIFTHTVKSLKAGKRYKISLQVSLSDSAVFRTDSLCFTFSSEAPGKLREVKGEMLREFAKSYSYSCALPVTQLRSWQRVEVEFVAPDECNFVAIGLPRSRYTRAQYRRDLTVPVRALARRRRDELAAYYYLDDIQLIEE